MRIKTTDHEDVKVVGIYGMLDTGTAPDLDKHLSALIDQGHVKIILNFEDLDFIASTGLRVILSTGKILSKAGSEIRICTLNDTVQDIFDMSGFISMFKVFETAEEALENF